MDQKEGNSVHLLCPFYQPNLEIRRIAHGETNTAKVDNGAKFPLKLLLLIWSRTLLFAAFCFLLYRTPIRDTESTTATGIKQEHSFLHSTKVTKTEREDKAAWDLCSHLLCGFEEVFLSRALALCTEASKEKHSCLTKSTCSTSVCKKWKKKLVLYHIFSTSLKLSKEQGTWKQLFIESTAVSRRLEWAGQYEIHKLHFFPDLVL